jgi:hypothetical protein
MLNTDVNVCNVCRCTQYGNKPANTNDENQCNEAACEEATENYKNKQLKESEVHE